MKKIYTSYFANAKHIPPEIPQIAVARSQPGWWKPKVKQIESRLMPSAELLRDCRNGKLDDLGWKRQYILEVGPSIKEVLNDLPNVCVLLCWEKNPNACHRKIAFDMMRKLVPIEGGELPPASDKRAAASKQVRLNYVSRSHSR